MIYSSRIHMFLLLVSLVSIHFPFDVDTPSNENSLHPLAWTLEVLLLPLKLLQKPFH